MANIGRRCGWVIAGAMACFGLGGGVPAWGQVDNTSQRYQINQQINNLRQDIVQLTQTITPLKKEYDAAKSAADDTSAALDATKKAVQDTRPPVEEARKKLGDANKKLDDLVRQLKQTFENSDDLKAAKEALDAAQHAADLARDKALAPLRATDPYKAALAEWEAAKAKLEQIKTAGDPNNLDVPIQAGVVVEKESVVSGMEVKVLEADAAWVAADKTLREAVARLANLRNAFEASLAENPDRAAALKAVDEARAAFKTAQDAMNDAMRQQSAADDANNKAAAEVARIQKIGQRLEQQKAAKNAQIKQFQDELMSLH